ncbi:hypothetical protein [Pelagerythrobacter aerophilus]|uniref:hypothetical protein n=1 Tax=Pelagerythrobacter aerophilus TaxID=2306995 RepID=UPI0011C46D5D|nr:hypothetical protein [Pelagerythrobacter aerophilus]
MTTKRDKLIKTVAELVASHSKEDWEFLAAHFTAVARIAEQCAEIVPKKNKASSRRKSTTKGTTKKRYSASDPLVAQLAHVLSDPKLGANLGVIKQIAIATGIKADLPKTRAQIEDMILKNLDESPEKSRQEKLQIAVSHLEDRQNDQSADYQRWVSLITKSKS